MEEAIEVNDFPQIDVFEQPTVAVTDIAILNRQRTELDPKLVLELAESIKETGLLHPIVIRRPHEGEDTDGLPYVLVAGGRRTAAFMYLKRDRIPCTLLETMDPLSAEIAELDENLKRANINWQDEVAAKARIHTLRSLQNPFQSKEQTAEEIGETRSNLSRDLKLAALIQSDPTLLKATSKGAAVRQAKFKENIATKLANVEKASNDALKQRLFIGDWCDFTAGLADKSVDCILSDLPYGIDQFEVQQGGENNLSKFDDSPEKVKADIARLVPELVRVVKPNGWICLFMSYEWHGWLMDQFKPFGLSAELPPWVWARDNQPGSYGHYPDLHAANRYEMIVVINAGSARLLKKPVENVLRYPALLRDEKLHNHQKPHELIRELISRFTVPGELVVDVCFGSGAHLAAAADMGREFRGCESNPAMLDPALVNVSQFYRTGSFGRPTGAEGSPVGEREGVQSGDGQQDMS